MRQRLSQPCELIVVDSAADPAVAAVAAGFPQVRLVRSVEPLLAGPARNLGAAASTAPHLAFIDADCVAEPGWLAAAHDALGAGAEGVGGQVGDLLPHHPIAAADNLLQFYDLACGRPAGPAAYLPSCNLAVRREIFEMLGGFAAIPLGEDVLLTRRIVARGPGRLRFEPAMAVRHRGRRSLASFWRHHLAFGRARGEHALMTAPLEARLARFRTYAALLIVKRLAWMTLRIARWSPARLPAFVLLSPLVALGVAAWAAGVVAGSRLASRSAGEA